MSFVWVIYLISVMEVFSGPLILLSVFGSAILCCIYGGVTSEYTNCDDEWLERFSKFLKKVVTVNITLVLLVILTPDKETSYAMLAAYGVETIAQTEEVQELAGKSLDVLNKYMDQYLEESSGDTE